MNYIKNFIKILLLAQCLLLSCEYKVVTTEQNILNLADFVKCPFNEEFDDKTNLEKYVLKKFGKPDSVRKRRAPFGDIDIINKIDLRYEKNYSFSIYRGVKKRFEFFRNIKIFNYSDLKYGINEKTTIRDIESLFGKPEMAIKGSRTSILPNGYADSRDDDTLYAYRYNNGDNLYYYFIDFGFKEGKLNSIYIDAYFGRETVKLFKPVIQQ